MNDADLILAVERLIRSTPQETWAPFVAAFANYTNTIKDECISSQTDDLQRTQGRAQQCRVILDLLRGSHSKKAERLEDQRK